MSANHESYPVQKLDRLEDVLDRITGFAAALELLSEDLRLAGRSPESSAFWAILGGINAAVVESCDVVASLRHVAPGDQISAIKGGRQ